MIQSFKYISPDFREDVERFECSDEISVELFLKETALNLHQLRSAVTRLYFDENQNLVGYFTLYNDHVHFFPGQIARHGMNLPEGIDLFPAIKLHYLGVDSRYRGRRIGENLLLDVVESALSIAERSGCNFITLEALPSSVEFYEKYGFKVRQRPASGARNPLYNMFLKLDELQY